MKSAQQSSEASKSDIQNSPSERDGQHDFDFEIGSWKIHLSRLQDRLAGSTTWVQFDGTSVTRKVWDGRAQIEEFETDGAGGHIEGLTLRTFNPKTQQKIKIPAKTVVEFRVAKAAKDGFWG